MRRRWLIVLLLTLLSFLAPAAPRNFYVKEEAKDKLSESDKKTAIDDKNSAESKSPTPANEPNEKPVAVKKDFQIQSTFKGDFAPPLDPFGLAAIFHERWDFSSFMISQREELRFRLNAARARTLRLAKAFSALSEEVENRQRNLNSAALAAYLLSRDQHSWSPLEGRNLTEAQMLAVRATMNQDIRAMHSALTDYETLRTSLNESAEQLASLEKSGLPGDDTPNDTAAVTVPNAEIARRQTQDVLNARDLPLEALKAALAAETLRTTTDRRQSIASFAPPPPSGRVIMDSSGNAPALPSPDVMKDQPRGATMSQPERLTVAVETPINAPVFAVRDGVVAYAGPFRGYGDMIIMEHAKGEFTVYSYLSNIQVTQRQSVKAGTIMGRAGTLPEKGRTGLHFQVRKGATAVKPEDWLKTKEIGQLITKK